MLRSCQLHAMETWIDKIVILIRFGLRRLSEELKLTFGEMHLIDKRNEIEYCKLEQEWDHKIWWPSYDSCQIIETLFDQLYNIEWRGRGMERRSSTGWKHGEPACNEDQLDSSNKKRTLQQCRYRNGWQSKPSRNWLEKMI